MLNKTLKVKIPKKFKKQLIARFSFSNAKLSKYKNDYEISTICPLCIEYKHGYLPECGDCPFIKFEVESNFGCMTWIQAIMPSAMRRIFVSGFSLQWHKCYHESVRMWLGTFKNRAKKYIEWV